MGTSKSKVDTSESKETATIQSRKVSPHIRGTAYRYNQDTIIFQSPDEIELFVFQWVNEPDPLYQYITRSMEDGIYTSLGQCRLIDLISIIQEASFGEKYSANYDGPHWVNRVASLMYLICLPPK